MPANLNLLPRKEFELVLEDGTLVPGQFGTWALHRFGQKRKLGLSQLGELFFKLDAQGNNIADPGADVYIDFILAAIEYKCRQNKVPFAFTDLDLCKWVDDTRDPNALVAVFVHSAKEDDEPVKDEKKSLTELVGEPSKDLQPAQA